MALQNLEELYQANSLLINAGGAIVSIGIIWKWGKGVSKWVWNKMCQFAWLFSEQHEHETIIQSLANIEAQLTNNGGTSLKDAIDRIETNQEYINSYTRTALHANPKAIFETDAEGRVLFVNKAFLRLTEFSASEVEGLGWMNLLASSNRQKVHDMWMDAVASKRDFDEIIQYQRHNGERYYVHALAYCIKDVEKNVLGYLGEVTPIEE